MKSQTYIKCRMAKHSICCRWPFKTKA